MQTSSANIISHQMSLSVSVQCLWHCNSGLGIKLAVEKSWVQIPANIPPRHFGQVNNNNNTTIYYYCYYYYYFCFVFLNTRKNEGKKKIQK